MYTSQWLRVGEKTWERGWCKSGGYQNMFNAVLWNVTLNMQVIILMVCFYWSWSESILISGMFRNQDIFFRLKENDFGRNGFSRNVFWSKLRFDVQKPGYPAHLKAVNVHVQFFPILTSAKKEYKCHNMTVF